MPNRYGRPDECQAYQASDQMFCRKCGLAWDVNDTEPPPCRKDKPDDQPPPASKRARRLSWWT